MTDRLRLSNIGSASRDMLCLSVTFFTQFPRNAWSCAAISRPSVSFFSFLLLSLSHDFRSLVLLVLLINCPWRGFSRYLWTYSSTYVTLSLLEFFSSRISSLRTAFSLLYWDSSRYLFKLFVSTYPHSSMFIIPRPTSDLLMYICWWV